MANFIGLVYATLKNEGVDTSGMSTDEAVAKFKELQKKSGGDTGKEGTPAEQRKLKEKGVVDNFSEKRKGLDLVHNVKNTGNFKADSKELDDRFNKYSEANKDIYLNIKNKLGIEGKPSQIQVRKAVQMLEKTTNNNANTWDYSNLAKVIGANYTQIQNARYYVANKNNTDNNSLNNEKEFVEENFDDNQIELVKKMKTEFVEKHRDYYKKLNEQLNDPFSARIVKLYEDELARRK